MKKFVCVVTVLSMFFVFSISNVFAYSDAPGISEFEEYLQTALVDSEETEETSLPDEVLTNEVLVDKELLFSDETTNDDNFSITSGLSKNTNLTFDSDRTIFGEALDGTLVVIDVYSYNNQLEEFELLDSYEVEVGASGIFSKSVSLNLGENYILITAKAPDTTTLKTAVIKRKDLEIKFELEKGIVFPGQNLSHY